MEVDESITNDESQQRNVYGSLIDPEECENSEASEDLGAAEVRCSCNGACARRTGQGSCSCKEANQNCMSNCLCNKAKCKNKASEAAAAEQVNTPVDPDGEVQLFNEVQSSATQVEEFVSTLTRQDIEYLLRNVLAMGRGSLDFAKKLLDEKNAPPPSPPSPGNNSSPE